MGPAVVIVFMLLAAPSGGRVPGRPAAPSELVAAARSGDGSRLDLAAKRAGAGRVHDLLRYEPRPHAALLAADLPTWRPSEAWLLLTATSELSGSPDRPLAAAAARATRTLAQILRDHMPEIDVPAPAIFLAQERCLQTAQRDEIWADVRVLNLECAVLLAQVLSMAAHAPALSLVGDDDAQVRLAAASLLTPPATDDVRDTLILLLRNDPDDDVAAAAAAALCLDETPQLAAEDRARIQRLLRVTTLDPGAAAILLDCE